MNKRRFAALATGSLLLVVGATAFLLSGCSGGASQPRQQERPRQSNEVALPLRPNNGSGVRGTATFRRVHNGGVVVKLELHNLPKPNAFYLAHIHPGTCAQREEEERGHGGHEAAAAGKEVEWPLLPVRSGTRGNGSSTTTLKHTSIETLFSGHSKHVNVHAVGSGSPPVLACANLEARMGPPVKTVTEPTTPKPATSAVAPPSSSASSAGGSSGKGQAEQRSEADCRLAVYVAQKNMSRQKAHAFSELLADMIRTMEGLSWPEGSLRNAALDHLGVPRYSECRVRKE